jgi:hypothetical protein
MHCSRETTPINNTDLNAPTTTVDIVTASCSPTHTNIATTNCGANHHSADSDNSNHATIWPATDHLDFGMYLD